MRRTSSVLSLLLGCVLMAGCASEAKQKNADFSTSGSPEADQRAEERVAKTQQLRGEGLNQSDTKRSLYERLGKEDGIKAIVDDWVNRAMNDPRVNFERKGVKTGGVLGVGGESQYWKATPAAVQQMKKHFVQFLVLASGGPAHYDGKDLKPAHEGMAISNDEFEACEGDLQKTLDALSVRTQEQKELLQIVESTRPQIVEKR
ncbi:MAG: group I truncated hemoglobin [Tepidisphaeraceae bacterium]